MILCREEHAKNLNSRVFPGMQGGPLMHIIAAKAVALKEASTPEFAAYQRQIAANAKALAAALMARGFRLVSGGTDNHLMLMDLRDSELTGKLAQETLERAGITANRNTVPFETRSPFVTSGVRIGTPAVTTRGMKEQEMEAIAELIQRGLDRVGDDDGLVAIAAEVRTLCERFPVYRKNSTSPEQHP
jgi:glycine hydroxymethyltransferase